MNLNDPERARTELNRAVESGQQEAIARAAMANIWPLLNSHTEQLISAVSELDTTSLERYPVLRLVHPMTAVLARSPRPFRPLFNSEDARSMAPEEVDFLILAQVIAFRSSGDIPAAMLYSKRLQDRLQQTPIESRDRLDGPLWYFHLQIGSTLLAAGDSGRALLEFATARQLGRLSAQKDAERVVLARLALAHAVRGALADAERALGDARKLPEPTLAHVTASITTENAAAAIIAVDRLAPDLEEAIRLLGDFDANDLIWPFALLARTRAALAQQRPEQALETIRLAKDAHPVSVGSFAADVIYTMSIQASLHLGDFASARRCARDAEQPGVLTSLAVARLSLREGNLEEAAQQLRQIRRDHTLGPAQGAESVLLSGWLECALTGDLSLETALQIFRVLRQADYKRLVEILPRQMIDHVRARLPQDSIEEFDGVTNGHAHFEMTSRPDLTVGERRVLRALATHQSTTAIAASFHVSPNTIKSQLRSLYRKLGCSTREEAVRIGTRMHLLSDASGGAS